MGSTAQNPQTPLGAMCQIIKTSKGELVVTGEVALLREFFEANPGQWLRNLALTKEDKNG